MRVAILAAIFIVLGTLFFLKTDAAVTLGPGAYGSTPTPNLRELLAHPNKYLAETLKDGVKPSQFWKATSKINTLSGFERLFKKQAAHNPFVWRQGGSGVSPSFYSVAGPPFDIYGPHGVTPGCLNLLCQPPQGALWVDGICWCTQ